jgi:hypothetical protein
MKRESQIKPHGPVTFTSLNGIFSDMIEKEKESIRSFESEFGCDSTENDLLAAATQLITGKHFNEFRKEMVIPLYHITDKDGQYLDVFVQDMDEDNRYCGMAMFRKEKTHLTFEDTMSAIFNLVRTDTQFSVRRCDEHSFEQVICIREFSRRLANKKLTFEEKLSLEYQYTDEVLSKIPDEAEFDPKTRWIKQ